MGDKKFQSIYLAIYGPPFFNGHIIYFSQKYRFVKKTTIYYKKTHMGRWRAGGGGHRLFGLYCTIICAVPIVGF